MTKKFKSIVVRAPKITLAVIAGGVLMLGFTLVPMVQADRFEQQIQELLEENDNHENALNELRGEAASYQEVIDVLSGQIAQLQAEINKSIAKQNELQKKIDETQAELDRQRKVLAADIKAMYVDGDITTIEMLATSKNLSEFVDKEAYRNAVQKKIQETLKKITKLQSELKAQKQEVERLLTEQKAQQKQLDDNKAEQSRLLSLNQQQQNQFSQEVKENNERVAELRRKQAEENCRIFGCGGGVLGGGGYPWGHAACIHTGQVEGSCYNYDWGVNGSIWNWNTGGWGYRNCTDWVAFRSGGKVPSAGVMRSYVGSGNAKWWDNAAAAMGRQVDSSPSPGDSAISNGGTYGHVMYVENVNSDGSVTISDYNRAGTGKYEINTFEKVGDGLYRTPTGRTYALTFVTW